MSPLPVAHPLRFFVIFCRGMNMSSGDLSPCVFVQIVSIARADSFFQLFR